MPRPASLDPRTKTVCFRVTAAEDREIEAWLARNGNATLSETLRRMVLEAARHDDDT